MKNTMPSKVYWAAILSVLSALGTAALAQTGNPPQASITETESGSETVRATPRYLLLGSHGRAVRTEDFRDRFQLIAFGFTSCPDVCPTTMVEMQQVLAALGPRAKHLQPIFITVDPQRDTPAVLAAYTRNFDERILGMTGSMELIRWAANNFKVQFSKVQEPGADANVYTMDHTAGFFLIGPDGQLLNKIAYGTSVQDITSVIERWFEADGK